jgi:hypothetical protein
MKAVGKAFLEKAEERAQALSVTVRGLWALADRLREGDGSGQLNAAEVVKQKRRMVEDLAALQNGLEDAAQAALDLASDLCDAVCAECAQGTN